MFTTAAIFFIVVGAFIFSRFIVLTQYPNEMAKWVQAAGLSPAWILLAVMALYLLLGTFLDEVSTILITVPVTLPLVLGIGYDGIWFGIFVTVMCTIGLITPPTGMTVFVIQAQNPDIPVAAHLPRHAAVPGRGLRAGRNADRVAGARVLAARGPEDVSYGGC